MVENNKRLIPICFLEADDDVVDLGTVRIIVTSPWRLEQHHVSWTSPFRIEGKQLAPPTLKLNDLSRRTP